VPSLSPAPAVPAASISNPIDEAFSQNFTFKQVDAFVVLHPALREMEKQYLIAHPKVVHLLPACLP
jgi:hypothetical protein